MKNFFRQKNNRKAYPAKLQRSRGFTLVESLIAISIFSVSVVALMSFLSQGISNTGYAKKKIIATYLAQEGIEFVRNTRDSYILYTSISPSLSWATFRAKLMSCNLGSECGFDTSVPINSASSIFLCSAHTEQCKLYINNGNYNTNVSGSDSGFVRNIRMDLISADEIKIYSTVSWTHNGQSFNITLVNDLFNWTE